MALLSESLYIYFNMMEYQDIEWYIRYKKVEWIAGRLKASSRGGGAPCEIRDGETELERQGVQCSKAKREKRSEPRSTWALRSGWALLGGWPLGYEALRCSVRWAFRWPTQLPWEAS